MYWISKIVSREGVTFKFYLPILVLFISCTENKKPIDKKEIAPIVNEVVVPEFQSILDSANVHGAILIYDLKEGKYYSNDLDGAKKPVLPASTFKITNSIIALETRIVENDSTLSRWDGKKRSFKIWEQDLILRDAFHLSCVPCYQEVARKIGVKRMNEYLNKLEYGNIVVDSTTIDLFWLEGEFRISAFQQIDFLKRFYQSQLPITKRTEEIMKRMMVIEKKDEYKLSGKTGLSTTNGISNGWFVGYIESQNKTYFFATNLEPKENLDVDVFPAIRKELTFKALRQMGILE